MLIIGIQGSDTRYAELDVDIDNDSPRKIHDMLSKLNKNTSFESILCIENDCVLAHYCIDDDYDLTLPINEDQSEKTLSKEEGYHDEDDISSDEDLYDEELTFGDEEMLTEDSDE